MSYFKNAFHNHIYLMSVLENANIDELNDITGTIIRTSGKTYHINNFLVMSECIIVGVWISHKCMQEYKDMPIDTLYRIIAAAGPDDIEMPAGAA